MKFQIEILNTESPWIFTQTLSWIAQFSSSFVRRNI